MVPTAILIVLLGGVVFAVIGSLIAKVGKLESRLEAMERQHNELLSMISDAIIGQGERESLELKLRNLLGGR